MAWYGGEGFDAAMAQQAATLHEQELRLDTADQLEVDCDASDIQFLLNRVFVSRVPFLLLARACYSWPKVTPLKQ